MGLSLDNTAFVTELNVTSLNNVPFSIMLPSNVTKKKVKAQQDIAIY